MMATKAQFIAAILGMTYGDLMEVCGELASANRDKETRPKLETAEEFASLLHDWADAADDR